MNKNTNDFKKIFHVPIDSDNYTFLYTKDDVRQDLEELVGKLQGLLMGKTHNPKNIMITKGMCRVLLQKYGYNMKVFDQLKENTFDIRDILFSAGVSILNWRAWQYPPRLFDSDGTENDCFKCFLCNQKKTSPTKGLNCFHMACGPHWKHYLKSKYGNPAAEITCIESTCELHLYDEMVHELLGMTQTPTVKFED